MLAECNVDGGVARPADPLLLRRDDGPVLPVRGAELRRQREPLQVANRLPDVLPPEREVAHARLLRRLLRRSTVYTDSRE